ncbi:MAG: hypothetical protein WKF84_21650 [Pyrinomonadaceae bacterium]
MLEAGGWRVDKLFHQREISNLVASIGYVMKDRRWFPGLANTLIAYPWSGGHLYVIYHPLACLLSACGQTGRMTVWAERQEDD